MDRNLILKMFLIGAASVFIGTLLKILYYGFSEGFLIFGIVLTFTAYVVSFIDVVKTSNEKSFWIFLFILFPTIAPLFYLIRKKPHTEI